MIIRLIGLTVLMLSAFAIAGGVGFGLTALRFDHDGSLAVPIFVIVFFALMFGASQTRAGRYVIYWLDAA